MAVQKAAGYGGIKLVQMKGSDSDWMGMTNKYGQAWEVPVTPKLPWDFRIVSDDSQEVSHLPTVPIIDRSYGLWSVVLHILGRTLQIVLPARCMQLNQSLGAHWAAAMCIYAVQVTAIGLINSQGLTGDVPTNVQFALKGGAVSVSTATDSLCWSPGLSRDEIERHIPELSWSP